MVCLNLQETGTLLHNFEAIKYQTSPWSFDTTSNDSAGN